MISSPTTLILGAGASCDLGYPTGERLRERILTTIEDQNGLYEAATKAGFTREQIVAFRRDFEHSQVETIDEYLRHRREHRDIGRFGIAHEIMMFEDEEQLMKNGRKTWYYQLRRKLGSGIDDLERNKLNVITFNYDRAFEHYLYQAFTAITSSIEDRQRVATCLLEKIGPLHVHGTLGFLSWQRIGGGRPFSSTRDANVILQCSSEIILAHDRFEGGVHSSDGRTLPDVLRDSETICFLGFGFAEPNLKKLGVEALNVSEPRRILASAVGIGDVEKKRIGRRLPTVQYFDSIAEVIAKL